MDQYLRWLAPVVRRMWPATFHGLEHLPEDRDYVVVANHSGMGIAELHSLILAWYERFGFERPVAGMAHPGAFRIPPLAHYLRAFGAVEATRRGADAARAAGVPLLLFPGGDIEATRPLWHADRVEFAGRTGWVRLARDHRLAVVPLCITGSHRTLPILAGGRTVSWLLGTRPLLGVHRAPLTALSVATAAGVYAAGRALGVPSFWRGAAAWASMWPTMVVPWVPARIGFHLLPPISAEQIALARDSEIYERVVGTLERTLRASQGRF